MVKVYWRDSVTPYGMSWTTEDEVEETHDLECISIGYLIRDTPNEVILAPHIAVWREDSREYCGLMVIPQSAIIDILDLQEALVKEKG